jgi:hypothetical protein
VDHTPTPSTNPQAAEAPTQSIDELPAPAESESEEEEPRTKRTRKPSHRMLDILSGRTVSSPHPSDSLIMPGVQVPTVVEEPEGESTAVALMAVDLVEYAM